MSQIPASPVSSTSASTVALPLSGRVAIVTGASRGIGRAVALEFVRQGAMVIAVARQAELLAQVVEQANQLAGASAARAEVQTADVTDGDRLRKLADDVAARHGKIDILVNNAGITRDTLFPRMEDSQWDEVITANLRSVFLMTRAVTPHMMRNRWGRIISISSVVGLHGNKGQANYAASKAGIVGFTKSVARELAGRRITANVVAPGFITTDMTDKLSEDKKKEVLSTVPLARMGEPAEIAGAVVFLASEAASYITGIVMPVDGGMTM